MYQVNLTKFTGPLDLLLSLIEEKKLAINEISLAQVAEQFLDYLKNLEKEFGDLNRNQEKSFEYQRVLSDFLVVASRLILIKSRALLPTLVLTEEEETDIKDLGRRLGEYKKIRELARELGQFARGREAFYAREFYRNMQVVFYPPKDITPAALYRAYEAVIRTLPKFERLETDSVKKVVTLEEKMKELLERVAGSVEASFAQVTAGAKKRIDIVLTFLAILMLFRKQILEISQDNLFGPITIKSKNSNG